MHPFHILTLFPCVLGGEKPQSFKRWLQNPSGWKETFLVKKQQQQKPT
jgi:hypothetical protein